MNNGLERGDRSHVEPGASVGLALEHLVVTVDHMWGVSGMGTIRREAVLWRRAKWNRVTIRRSNAPVEIRLQPFGAIEGILLLAGQPQAEKRIQLVDPNHRLYWGAFSLDFAAFQAQTDSEGRFRIDHVPAGDFLLFLNHVAGIPYSEETKVRVSAGELNAADW